VVRSLRSPRSRQQTAAFIGIVIDAVNYLLRFESHQRLHESEIRRRTRNELAQRGVIATKGEIRKWKPELEREAAAAEQTSIEGWK
jgi:hypothetical protein